MSAGFTSSVEDWQEDPLADLSWVLTQLRSRRLLGTRSCCTTYLLLAADAVSAEDAVCTAAAHGWDTSSYAVPEGVVIRLSHRRRVTVDLLRRDRAAVGELVRATGTAWFGFAVEALDRPSRWDELAQQARQSG